MSVRVGVVLSGCGVFDGSEIHEAVSILISLDRRGAQAICIAPNQDQAEVINHLNQQPQDQRRSMLEESARIARGKVRDIAEVSAEDFDALIFPGGYGAAKNLCTFAKDGAECTVQPDVERLLRQMHDAKKPIGMACISPVLAARVFGRNDPPPHLTIGSDKDVAKAVNAMGAQHHTTGSTDVHVDPDNLIVTTPCYMHDVGPWTVYEGAEKMVEQVLRMTGDTASFIRSQMATMPMRT
jgi:enhancing lycopene biosynthesis protein 2